MASALVSCRVVSDVGGCLGPAVFDGGLERGVVAVVLVGVCFGEVGDRIALAAYLGGSDKFAQAIADFAEKYADQNELDYAALQAAVKDGRVQTTTDI